MDTTYEMEQACVFALGFLFINQHNDKGELAGQ